MPILLDTTTRTVAARTARTDCLASRYASAAAAAIDPATSGLLERQRLTSEALEDLAALDRRQPRGQGCRRRAVAGASNASGARTRGSRPWHRRWPPERLSQTRLLERSEERTSVAPTELRAELGRAGVAAPPPRAEVWR